jgi:hypothetical protein
MINRVINPFKFMLLATMKENGDVGKVQKHSGAEW